MKGTVLSAALMSSAGVARQRNKKGHFFPFPAKDNLVIITFPFRPSPAFHDILKLLELVQFFMTF